MPMALSCRCRPVSQGSRQRIVVEREAGPALVVALPAASFAVVEVVIAVPQQAGQIVGRGADQGVLKVDDAKAPVRRHQEIAAVVVTMNQALGLADGIVDERLECLAGGCRQWLVEQGAQEPLDEDAEFVAERLQVGGMSGASVRCNATRLSMATARAESCIGVP